jgi:hypothetical protein
LLELLGSLDCDKLLAVEIGELRTSLVGKGIAFSLNDVYIGDGK